MVINKKNVDQRNISRIGITLLILCRPYISGFYPNFEMLKCPSLDFALVFGNYFVQFPVTPSSTACLPRSKRDRFQKSDKKFTLLSITFKLTCIFVTTINELYTRDKR
ncbi:hypothetical protein D7Z29_03385 [Escherichia fergusonii]|nr:hypothetical protein D7Z29_03385 [Escherichia fergusonii]